MKDIYQDIRKSLPVDAKIAFVFDLDARRKTQAIYYTRVGLNNKFHRRLTRAYIEDGLLIPETSPMEDDGLPVTDWQGAPVFSNKAPPLKDLKLDDQYIAANRVDRVILSTLLRKNIGDKEDCKIAKGVDVTIYKEGFPITEVFTREEWTCADTFITLLRDYPVKVLEKESSSFGDLIPSNIERILHESVSMVEEAPKTQATTHVVEDLFQTLRHHVPMCEYDPVLKDPYFKFLKTCTSFLMRSV